MGKLTNKAEYRTSKGTDPRKIPCFGIWGRLFGHRFRSWERTVGDDWHPHHTHQCTRCGLWASRIKYPAGPHDPDIAD